ncbi:MAG: MurR/RpiR family transcriptional regulator [Candidatus Marinimicrobia bacterium]|nr:MurR/RpiR family transcriptional regulator [Candidatus Neomarinimicrobiota bacterium]
MLHTELRKQIRENYKKLSKNLQVVADFFIENFDKIPFLSVQEIAKNSGASVASVVRFAQRIGYSGFAEIRNAVAENLQQQLKNEDRFPLIKASAKDEDDILTSVANQDIQNINQTFKLIDRNSFRKAVEMIFDARTVYTAGLGISFLLSRILSYQLNQVGVRSHAMQHDTSPFLEQSLLLDKDDLLVVLSFPPYSTETIDLVKEVKGKSVKVVAITDKPAAPATFHADVSLLVKSENMLFTNSFAAISVLINAIATQCACHDYDKAQKMIEASSAIQKPLVES